jgi:hypothetical protein
MTIRIADILAQRPDENLFGRAPEMAGLMQLVSADHPVVLHLHGLPGIGKSAIVRQFGTQARAAGAAVVTLDCGAIEPTERGVLRALGGAVGLTFNDLAGAAAEIGQLATRIVLVFDRLESFRLMDAWLCQTLVPALPSHVRIALFGRLPPAPHWLAPDWHGLFASRRLGALPEADAGALLLSAGIAEADTARIAAIGRGHPLALHLTARARLERPQLDLTEFDLSGAIAGLADMTLADIAERPTRRALEAASLVRRVTEPLLAAMFPAEDAPLLYARLRNLAVIEQLHDGLALHEPVRSAVAASLRAADPERSRSYRVAAWRHLQSRFRTAPPADLWRHTADAIYLLDNPIIRDAFFPNAPQTLTVAPAQAADGDAIMQMADQHDGPDAASYIALWWQRQPAAFHVVRDAHGTIVGFYCLAVAEQIDPFLLTVDPVAAAWWRHVRHDPAPRGQKSLFLRRWLSIDGEAPSAVQAACWLDIKRTYLELRPQLRRVYLTLRDPAPYAAAAANLGFAPLDAAAPSLGGVAWHTAMLDFGTGSVDGWIATLLGNELGADAAGPLDAGARELVLDQRRIALTQKEFALMQHLYVNADRAVPRDELLNDVWGWKVIGSNVIDAVVRGVRRKLGAQAAVIETVRGVGYRYRPPVM